MNEQIKISDHFAVPVELMSAVISINGPMGISEHVLGVGHIQAISHAINTHDQHLARIAELEDGIKLILECESPEDMHYTAKQLLEQSK